MTGGRPAAPAAALAAIPLLALALGAAAPGASDAPEGRAYLDGPPPGHTGGFGEPTCRACHFDRPLNPGAGGVRLEGVPDRYAADSTYELTVALRRAEMERGGFQLAARWRQGAAAGCSAGRLRAAGDRVAAVTGGDSACSVTYLQHTEEGTAPVEGGSIRWTVRWTAPSGSDGGPVAFHVAANAANGDDSEFGDRIYAAEAVSRRLR